MDRDVRVDFSGAVLDTTTPVPGCRDTDAGAEVFGVLYADVNCGLITSDRQRMTYAITVDEATPELGTSG